MPDRAEQLRRHGNRVVWCQAVLVTAAVTGALFWLLGYRPQTAPAVPENRSRVTLLNLNLPGRAGWERWLECHDPGLFSRSDAVHGYLAALPPGERALPAGLDVPRIPELAPAVVAPPAFSPLPTVDAGRREPFSGYRPGALPKLALPVPELPKEPVLEWSSPVAGEFSLAGVEWRPLVAPDEPDLQLMLSRSAGTEPFVRIEVIAGGSVALQEAVFRKLLPELESLLRPGQRTELRIHWPRGGKP